MTKLPEIEPANVEMDHAGLRTNHWFIRLPKDLTADQIKEPDIWKRMLGRRDKAFRKHDYILAVGFDETFAVECRVIDCGPTFVSVTPIKVIKYPERTTPLFSDDKYKIVWSGTGFAVQRREDGLQMGPVFGSEAQAIQHLHRQYPAPV